MSQAPPPKPPADNTGVVVATTAAAGGGMIVIILAIVAVFAVMSLCVIGILIALLLPAIQAAREAARSAQSMNNVRQIGIAVMMHETKNGRLPPQFTVDPQGQPLESWRTLLVPYMEGQSDLYASPREGAPKGMTNYVVVAGDGFMFNKDQEVSLGDLQDGASSTIMILEIANSDIRWDEPRDVTLDDLQFEAEGAPDDAPNLVREGAAVGFADGSVHRLPQGVTREDLRPRLTISGAEAVGAW